MLAAHMFVFYFGIVADITPPVCLAAYAGAGLARANPFMTGVRAFMLATAAYIIPYVFVMNPQMILINAEPLFLMISIATAIIGMIGVSSAMIGYLVRKAHVWERIVLFVSGLFLISPNMMYSGIGIVMLIIIAVVQSRRPKEMNKLSNATM